MINAALSLAVPSHQASSKTQHWSFTVSFVDNTGIPRWSVTSPPKYDSKGEALYFAYAAAQQRGFTPAARGISITTKQYKE
jgi:hypothetical protein